MNFKIRAKKKTFKDFRNLKQILTLLLLCLLCDADEQRFGNEECHKIDNNSNCNCTKFISQAFDIKCWNKMPEKELTIFVPPYPDEPLRIGCSQITAPDYALLSNMKVGSSEFVEIRNCPWPGEGDIAVAFEKLGIADVTEFFYDTSNLYGNLTRLHSNGLQNLNRLRLKLNKSSPLPEDLFHDLGNLPLWEVRIQNAFSPLPSKIFAPLESLTELHLVDSNLTDLPAGILSNKETLISLTLQGNELKHLITDNFKNLTSLQTLDLSSNAIETLQPHIFESLTDLREIDLSSNRISELPKNLFTKTKGLSEFRLSDNRVPLSTLTAGFFADLPWLRTITLNCDLKSIPGDTFANSTKIKKINLKNNYLKTLPENLFYDQTHLLQLDLSNNHLIELPNALFERNKNLRVLKLNNNKIKVISTELLKPLRALQKLYINDNHLKRIDSDAFQEKKHLKALELQNNRFELNDDILLPFYDLQNLEVLNLRNTSLHPSPFDLCDKLHTLDLSFNNISMIFPFDLSYSSNAPMLVNMSHNNISMIDFLSVTTISIYRTINDTKLIVDLNHNPINCDCQLLDFVRFLRGEIAKDLVNSITILADQIVCAEPANLKDKAVRELSYMDLLCDLDYERFHCPANCQCWERTYDSKIIVDCSNGNHTSIPPLPNPENFTDIESSKENFNFDWTIEDVLSVKLPIENFTGFELNMEHNNLLQLPTMQLAGYSMVTKLMLTGNKLSELSVENLPPNLKHLDLRNNKFRALNDAVLNYLNKSDTLESLLLSGNPWHCDCDASHLLKFAGSNSKKLHDLSQIRCDTPIKGLVFQKLTVFDICPVDNTLAILLTMLAAFLLLVSMVALLYIHYQMEIKVWLYGHKMCLWFVTEDELDEDKIYDAFISYSSRDENFVAQHLVPNLEQGLPAFKICVHYRDFMVGEYICTNIEKAVANSRRTIIILSRNFLESTWTRQEFRTAHLAALEERRPKVIVILYGDIENIQDLDAELKAYLKTNTYLSYNDPLFWQRLRYAMPHASKRGHANEIFLLQ